MFTQKQLDKTNIKSDKTASSTGSTTSFIDIMQKIGVSTASLSLKRQQKTEVNSPVAPKKQPDQANPSSKKASHETKIAASELRILSRALVQDTDLYNDFISDLEKEWDKISNTEQTYPMADINNVNKSINDVNNAIGAITKMAGFAPGLCEDFKQKFKTLKESLQKIHDIKLNERIQRMEKSMFTEPLIDKISTFLSAADTMTRSLPEKKDTTQAVNAQLNSLKSDFENWKINANLPKNPIEKITKAIGEFILNIGNVGLDKDKLSALKKLEPKLVNEQQSDISQPNVKGESKSPGAPQPK